MCRNIGKGFFFLRGENTNALHKALMFSPFKSEWNTSLLQSWISGFNPENLNNLAFPMCVASRNLPFEHHDQAFEIAGTLGEVIGLDTTNESAKDLRFCVNLKIDKGWVTNILLETEGGILPPQIVVVDYNKLSIRCRTCYIWKHMVKDCGGTGGGGNRFGRKEDNIDQPCNNP